LLLAVSLYDLLGTEILGIPLIFFSSGELGPGTNIRKSRRRPIYASQGMAHLRIPRGMKILRTPSSIRTMSSSSS